MLIQKNKSVTGAASLITGKIWAARNILLTTTIYELRKKYAGSALGLLWAFLHPIMFLGIYLFLYLVVFNVRFPDMSTIQYVIYVFVGLVPYLGLMEVVNTSVVTMRQNVHLVKNVIMPIELIPFRTMLVGLTAQAAGLLLIFSIILSFGELSSNIIFFPLVLFFFIVLLAGLSWLLGALGVLLPDLSTFTGLLMLLLLFLSPVAFRPEMVPEALQAVLYFNPVHYIIASFRWSLISGTTISIWELAIFGIMSTTTFFIGAWFFVRLKGAIVDYE